MIVKRSNEVNYLNEKRYVDIFKAKPTTGKYMAKLHILLASNRQTGIH
jgi:hypothetical protein